MFNIFAHSQDQHTGETSELYHTFTQPVSSVAIYIVAMVVLYLIFSAYFPKAMFPIIMAVNLLIGIFFFSVVPVVSILAISVGLLSALVVSLVLIS